MSELNEDWVAGFNRGRQIVEAVSRDRSAATLKQCVMSVYESVSIEKLTEPEALRLTGTVSALVTEVIRLNLELGNDSTGGSDDRPKPH